MNAIALDFAEFVSFSWLPNDSRTIPEPKYFRPVRWPEIQADLVIRRIANGIYPDRGYLTDPHPARADRAYLMGGYCSLYPQPNMLPQVATALDMWERRAGDWDVPYMVDCEVAYTSASPAVRWRQIDDFCSALEDRIQKTVGIYTRKDWWDKYTLHPHEPGWITHRPLWLALAANMRRDACPRDWWAWTIWQNLFLRHAWGVTGYVDLNEYSGNADELLAQSRRWQAGSGP